MFGRKVVDLGRAFLICSFLVFMGACGTTKISNIRDFDQQFLSGDYVGAAHFADQQFDKLTKKKSSSGKTKGLLWALQAGSAYRLMGELSESEREFDRAENMFKNNDLQAISSKAGQQAAAVLTNDSALPYPGTEYDRIMLNSYQAINALQQSKWDVARVQMNRAYVRQQKAVEYFKKNIEKEEKEINNAKKNSDQTGNNRNDSAIINKIYGDTTNWAAYPDFVNPFTTYIYGLFFLVEGHDSADFEKSRTALKRVKEMVPDNQVIADDLRLVDKVSAGTLSIHDVPQTVWVIFENGLGPKKTEMKYDIPTGYRKIPLVSIAFPKLGHGKGAYRYIVARNSSGSQLAKTSVICDMNRVIQTEFRKKLKGIYTRAVLSGISKAVMSKQASDKGGLAGAILGAIYTAASTHADRRIWTMLPNDFQVLRFERPEDGVVELEGPTGENVAHVEIPNSKFNIVYLREISPSLPGQVSTITIPDQNL